MRIITAYIAARVLRGILLAFLIVTAIIMLVDFVEATRNIGDDGSISVLKIAGLTALKVPQLIEETIPFVVLFGVMGTLYNLNKRGELVVLRASGLSAWRFLRPAIYVSGTIGIIWALLLNPFAAKSMAKYQDILLQSAMGHETDQASSTREGVDIWLREGSVDQQIVIHGTRPLPDSQHLTNVTFYFYDIIQPKLGSIPVSPSTVSSNIKSVDTQGTDNPKSNKPESKTSEFDTIKLDSNTNETYYKLSQFSRRIDADEAVLEPGYWQLGIVTENIADTPSTTMWTKNLISDFASIPTQITLDQLQENKTASTKISFWDLPTKIAQSDAAGFSTISLRLQWHKLLSLPLMLIAMTIIAAGVSMRNVRSGGALRLMLAGGVVGFSVYFFNTLMSAFGEAQNLPIVLAAWTVPAIVLLLSLAYLTRIEDG